MNSSAFMDKQIMGLSGGSQGGGGGDIFDLIGPQDERKIGSGADAGDAMRKEEILPSYDFQPIRTAGWSPPTSSGGGGDGGLDAARNLGSTDSKLASPAFKYSGMLESHELLKVNHGKEKCAYDASLVAEIDRTVKKYADSLMHVLEGVSSRLSQFESRTRYLENSVDEMKTTIGDCNGSTDGKLRQLENVLREVQTSLQVLRDKQDIFEAQQQLARMQASKGDHVPAENPKTGHLDQATQQSLQPLAAPMPPPPPAALVPNAPPPPPQQTLPPLPPLPQYSSQFPQPQLPQAPRDPYFNLPGPEVSVPPQQYQVQSHQPPPPHHYQSLPQPANTQLQPEEPGSYAPPPPPPAHAYPPGIRQTSQISQPPTGPPLQQFYAPNPGMYDPPPPASRPGSGQPSLSPAYGSFSDPYPGSPSHYNSAMKPSPFSSAHPSGGGNYPRLPTAQLLPQAQAVGSSPSGTPSGGRVPIDDVVDKVATMGFSREQVRATVKKLTENGQSVDLNVVLDKLMNDGEMIQPQKGWFGR